MFIGYGTTSIIASRTAPQTISDIGTEIVFDTVVQNFTSSLAQDDFDIAESVSVGETVFDVQGGELNDLLDFIASEGLPSLNSGQWFLVANPATNNESVGIFENNRTRIIGFSDPNNTITVESPSLVNRGVPFGLFGFELELIGTAATTIEIANLIAGTGTIKATGIGTNRPRFPLEVRNPRAESLPNVPTLFVEGSAVISGRFLRLGTGSIQLDSAVGSDDLIRISRSTIGVSTLGSQRTLNASNGISVSSMIEHVGAGYTDVVSYEVRVGFKTTGDPFVGIGSTTQFLIEGNAAPVLHLTPGKSYRFWQVDSSNLNNQIKFYTDQTKTTEITTGVTTVGSGPGIGSDYYTQLDMSMDTGVMFYYESDNGSYMGNMVVASVNSNMTGISTMKFTDIDIHGKIYDNNGSVGAAGSVLSSTGSGVEWTTVASGGGGSGEFNTGITSTVQIYPKSYEYTEFTFPSTSGKRYVIDSINVANVATGNTSINIITSIDQGDKSYIAYNTPIVSGGLVDLLKQPVVAEPSAAIKVWSNNFSYVGSSNIAEMYLNYTEYDDTDYFSVGVGTAGVATTSITGIFTSSTYPSMLQSIRLTNRTDTGDYPISVIITNGLSTTYLAKDLLIPRYASVEILDRPKRMELNGKIEVKVEQTSTIDVFVSGKKISSWGNW